jgi:SAM-dependent methyltransferase
MQYHYRVPPQNSHYEGVFDETERRWRQTCALDKASHVGEMLGDKGGEVASVLEVGCGTGDVIARISDVGIGRAFTGIDVTDPNLNNQGNQRPNLVFVQQGQICRSQTDRSISSSPATFWSTWKTSARS